VTVEAHARPNLRRLAVLRNSRFRLLFFANLASGLGNWLALIALQVDVYDRTHSGWWVGALLIANLLPSIFLGLLFGPLVDRLSRKGLMIASDLGRLAVFCVLPFAGSATAIVALSVVAGVGNAFFRPAVLAGVPNLVTDEELPDANAILQLVEWGSTALGPLLGGVLVAASGPDLAYWVNAVTFAVSAALVLAIPARLLQSDRPVGRGHWSELREGFQTVWHSRPLFTVLVVWTIAMVAIASTNLAEIFLAKRTLHSGDFGFGLLWSASGVGLIVGALLANERRPPVRPPCRLPARAAPLGARHGRHCCVTERLDRGARDGRRDGRQRCRCRGQHHPRPAGCRGPRTRSCACRDHERELHDDARCVPHRRPCHRRARGAGRLCDRRRITRRCGGVGRSPAPARGSSVNGRRDWTRERLVAAVRAGDRRALARAITLVENGDPLAYEVVSDVYPATGHAYAIGLTGPPGVGKSSLISALISLVRAEQQTVGVISVDPSSPFTHGALLGDRIRLTDHFLDPDVFIRSMGTRGHLGGLAETTLQSLLVLDAAGKDVVFLETVGTGQSEVGVLSIADTVVLALMPGSGDSIQALKAGIMEIPDVIVINKLDHPMAKTMMSEVRQVLSLGPNEGWKPPIVLTEALRGEGVDTLWEKIQEHRAWLESEGELELRRRRNLAHEVFAVASARARRHLEEAVGEDAELRRLLDEVQARKLDPLTAVREILEKVFHIEP